MITRLAWSGRDLGARAVPLDEVFAAEPAVQEQSRIEEPLRDLAA